MPAPSRTRLGLAVGWTLTILAACSVPGRSLPSVTLLEFDKLVHFALFAVFGYLWLRAVGQRATRPYLWVLALGIAYAGLTELYQGLLPFERQPDPYDALANAAGVCASALLYRHFKRQGPAT